MGAGRREMGAGRPRDGGRAPRDGSRTTVTVRYTKPAVYCGRIAAVVAAAAAPTLTATAASIESRAHDARRPREAGDRSTRAPPPRPTFLPDGGAPREDGQLEILEIAPSGPRFSWTAAPRAPHAPVHSAHRALAPCLRPDAAARCSRRAPLPGRRRRAVLAASTRRRTHPSLDQGIRQSREAMIRGELACQVASATGGGEDGVAELPKWIFH